MSDLSLVKRRKGTLQLTACPDVLHPLRRGMEMIFGGMMHLIYSMHDDFIKILPHFCNWGKIITQKKPYSQISHFLQWSPAKKFEHGKTTIKNTSVAVVVNFKFQIYSHCVAQILCLIWKKTTLVYKTLQFMILSPYRYVADATRSEKIASVSDPIYNFI